MLRAILGSFRFRPRCRPTFLAAFFGARYAGSLAHEIRHVTKESTTLWVYHQIQNGPWKQGTDPLVGGSMHSLRMNSRRLHLLCNGEQLDVNPCSSLNQRKQEFSSGTASREQSCATLVTRLLCPRPCTGDRPRLKSGVRITHSSSYY